MRKIREQPASIRSLPPEQLVRKCSELVRPEQLLSYEIIYSRFLVNLWQLIVVAERIRIPSDLHIDAKILLKISLADQNLPHQRFAIRHIQIGLNPHAADNLPSSFFHALFNLRKQVRIFLLHPLIGS